MEKKKGLIGTLFSYVNEAVYLFLHIVLFYILPIKTGVEDSAKMVVIQFFLTFSLGLMMGGFIRKREKFWYAFPVAIVYLPSVFIHFSAENISYCLWILIASFVGVICGQLALKPKLPPRVKKEKSDKKAKKQAASDKAAMEELDKLLETNKLGNSIPAEFDITDCDVVPDVQVKPQESFGKRFLDSLKRTLAEKKEKKTKDSKKDKEN